MGLFRYALNDVWRARTWTERLYFMSPIAEAAIRSVWAMSGAAHRRAAGANDAMASNVAEINRRALGAMGGSAGDHVRSGPFAGMAYSDQSTGSVLGPKLLGTYESELHPWVSDAIDRHYARIIDVGCAEGYYAVGMARACGESRVFAYDLDRASRENTKALAALNRVADRVEVGGLCDPAELERLLAVRDTLLIVDIEGAENELLDPAITPALAHADLIIETHEKFRPGVLWRLINRFLETHKIDLACAETDKAKIEAAVAAGVEVSLARSAVPEHRALPQLWIRLRAR